MKRRFLCFLLALVLVFALPLFVYAADEPTSTSGGIFEKLGDAAKFLKRLIVPDKDYFYNEFAELSAHVNERFGGIAYLYLMLNNFFNDLKRVTSVNLNMSIPNNYFYRGYQGMTLDVLTSAKPYIGLIRSVLTSGYCIFMAVACYHKVREFMHD